MRLDRLNRITVEDGKCGGRPCIRGYRLRVTDILDLLSAGASVDEILADYPFLESEDIFAAIEYAAHQADHPILQASYKFLVDHQLPAALARFLAQRGLGSTWQLPKAGAIVGCRPYVAAHSGVPTGR